MLFLQKTITSTSLENFSSIIGEVPIRSPAREELLRALEEARDAHAELTFEHLSQKAGSPGIERLTLIMANLVRHGLVKQVFRIESPSGLGGIADFDSLSEIPQQIEDWRTNQALDVRPENIVVIYKF